MSNPIVQIKRGICNASLFQDGRGSILNISLLDGELCQVYSSYNYDKSRLFIGHNSIPEIINPKQSFITTVTADATTGITANFDVYQEFFDSSTRRIENNLYATNTITIPPAGEDVAVGLITNGNQIIAGDKTFIGSILPENASATIGASNKKWSKEMKVINLESTFNTRDLSSLKIENKRINKKIAAKIIFSRNFYC